MSRPIAVACFLALLAFPALAATLEQGPFEIHYIKGGEVLAQQSLGILEAGMRKYSPRFPPGPQRIEVHICQSFAEFQRLGKLPGAARIQGFARAREGIIAVKAPKLLGPQSNYAAVLRHELLHVLLARNTDAGNLPRWLNEGIAMVLSREYRWSSLFRLARMYAGGGILEYDELSYAFASPGNETVFGDAYAQSLSMTKYLKKRVGEEAFWDMVRGLETEPFADSLRRWTGLTPRAFFEEWRASLWMVAFVSYSVSGVAAFQLMALLLVLGFLFKRWKGKRVMKRWAEEDDEEDTIIFPWELEDNESPYPWEED